MSAVSVLDYGEQQKDGKTYYNYELLSRTADGDEGGRHNLITAVVNNGKLYLLKVQAGRSTTPRLIAARHKVSELNIDIEEPSSTTSRALEDL